MAEAGRVWEYIWSKRRIYCGRLNYRNILAGESQIARFRFLHRFSYRCKRITHAIQPHPSGSPRKCPPGGYGPRHRNWNSRMCHTPRSQRDKFGNIARGYSRLCCHYCRVDSRRHPCLTDRIYEWCIINKIQRPWQNTSLHTI